MLEHANRKFLPPSLWTDEAFATEKRMWEEGFSASEIAQEIGGFSRNSIIGKLHRAGLTRADRKAVQRPHTTKARGDIDRSVTQRIARSVKLRRPSNGGPVIVKSVIRDELPMAADFLGVTFDDLEEGQCKFPRGEGRDIRFCGQPRAPGQPYCRGCCKVAFPFLTWSAEVCA